MLQSLREEREGKLQMLLSLRKNGLTSLFKEVRVFKVLIWETDFYRVRVLGGIVQLCSPYEVARPQPSTG